MSIIEQIKGYLNELDLVYTQMAPDRVTLPYGGEHLDYLVHLVAGDPITSLYTGSLLVVPQDRLGEAMRLAGLLNVRTLGAFLIDPESHRLIYSLPILAPGGPSRDQVGFALAARQVVDAAFPAFAAVAFGTASADEALAALQAEGRDDPDDGGLRAVV